MSERYFIEHAECKIMEGGFACGPRIDTVVTAIQFTKDGVTKWITNVESAGIPNFNLSDESIIDIIDEEEGDDFYIDKFEGILLGDYDEIEASLEENKDNPAAMLIKLVVDISRSDNEKTDELIKSAEGKYVDEI